MTSEDKGHYAKKHPPDTKIDPEVADALKAQAKGDTIPCAVVFKTAEGLGITPDQAGVTLDFLEIAISKCQLGLFGYGGGKETALNSMKEVSDALRAEITGLAVNNKIKCKQAWETAEKLNQRKMEVSSACEAMGIKISSCQLGAFK